MDYYNQSNCDEGDIHWAQRTCNMETWSCLAQQRRARVGSDAGRFIAVNQVKEAEG